MHDVQFYAFSAAHCLNIIGRSLKPEEIKVGLGRLSVDYYKHEPGAVVSSVSKPSSGKSLSHKLYQRLTQSFSLTSL